MKKAAVLLSIVLIFILSACSGNKSITQQKTQGSIDSAADTQQSQKDVAPTRQADTTPKNDKLIAATGTYSGRIDSHSVEVRMDTGEFTEFSILEIQNSFKDLPKNQKIRITYELGSYGQKIVKEITPLN